jgi:prolyl oligopeptidase
MGNMMVQRPDLFGACHCLVPLLDMRCYNKLLAGASWMAEYGNPDLPEEWSFLKQYSAYHQIDPSVVKERRYPALIMTTSTKDDRVHPYHARCFVKRIQGDDSERGEAGRTKGSTIIRRGDVFYYENIEGGHGVIILLIFAVAFFLCFFFCFFYLFFRVRLIANNRLS